MNEPEQVTNRQKLEAVIGFSLILIIISILAQSSVRLPNYHVIDESRITR